MAAQPTDFLLSVPAEERDCTIVLQLAGNAPPAGADDASGSGAGTGTAAAEGGDDDGAAEQPAPKGRGKQRRRGKAGAGAKEPANKRSKQESAAGAAAAAAATAVAAHAGLPACSLVLQLFSPKFRDWAARWAEGGAAAKEYVVQCRDEAEVAGMRLLLDFMHSMAKDLPTDAGELLQLLLAAREHAVDSAVLACTQRLLEQAPTLDASACVRLLAELATGASGEDRIKAAADQLTSACHIRMCQLLAQPRAEPDPWTPSGVQQLVHLFGPLQDMLNDAKLRELWCSLSFELLRDCMLDDANVRADCEITVLAACLHWLEAPQRRGSGTAAAQRRRTQSIEVSEIFSKIRFPDIPPSLLVDFYAMFPSLQQFDPDKELLLRAISSTAEPGMRDDLRNAMAAPDPPPDIFVLKKQCERWWLPRPAPPLSRWPAAVEFGFQCNMPAASGSAIAAKPIKSMHTFYWGGYCWYVSIQRKASGTTGIYLMPAKDLLKGSPPASSEPKQAAYGVKVAYTISLENIKRKNEIQVRGLNKFCRGHLGWGRAQVIDNASPDKSPLSWDAFWAEGSSPYCKDGAVRGKVTLAAPGN